MKDVSSKQKTHNVTLSSSKGSTTLEYHKRQQHSEWFRVIVFPSRRHQTDYLNGNPLQWQNTFTSEELTLEPLPQIPEYVQLVECYNKDISFLVHRFAHRLHREHIFIGYRLGSLREKAIK